MDVVLDGDKSVSRNKHAIIVYEPKQHLYLVQPGESSELVYLNDEVVLSPVKLKAYDKITVGEVTLLFMPLCGEQFNWSQMLQKFKNIRIAVRERKLVITVEAFEDIALEQALFDAKTSYFENVYSMKPVLKEKRIYNY